MGQGTYSTWKCMRSWKDLAPPSKIGCRWSEEGSPSRVTGSSLPIESTRLYDIHRWQQSRGRWRQLNCMASRPCWLEPIVVWPMRQNRCCCWIRAWSDRAVTLNWRTRWSTMGRRIGRIPKLQTNGRVPLSLSLRRQ